MTRLRIISDIHLEAHFVRYPGEFLSLRDTVTKLCHESILPIMDDEDEQVLLIAGDFINYQTLANYDEWYETIQKISDRFKHIYIILGNHEHWNHYIDKTVNDLRTIYKKFGNNITVCHNDIIDLDSKHFLVAGTMWTDMKNNCPLAKMHVAQFVRDFKKIYKHDGSYFTPDDAIVLFNKFHDTIQTAYQKCYNENKNMIVMSHHAPSYQSCSNQYKGHLVNPGFMSDYDEVIESYSDRIPLWIHGHVHNSCDYKIAKTRIVCNPRGIFSENLDDYNGKLIIDI